MIRITPMTYLKRLSAINVSQVMSSQFIFQSRNYYCKFLNRSSQPYLNHACIVKKNIKLCNMKLSTCGSLCWKCGESCTTEHKFCPACSTIQPLATEHNYFQLLGIKQQFHIDAELLSKHFKNLQRLYHPDKFSTASEREQQLSAQHSSSINKAYQTLADPLSRAEYLLQLSGLASMEAQVDLDKNFLTSVLELNEELADAETERQLADLKSRARVSYDLLLRDVSEAFRDGKRAEVQALVAQAKYYSSLLQKLREVERERGISD